MDTFKPKSKNTILEEFKYLSASEWEERHAIFKDFFGENVPEEYRPLIVNIINDLKKRGLQISETWMHEICFMYRTYLSTTKFGLIPKNDCINLRVSPYRKIEGLKSSGNFFIIKTFEEYLKIANFYRL